VRRITAIGLLGAAIVVACTSGGDDEDAAVDVVVADMQAYPRADFRSDDERRCVAEQVVDAIGLDRLREVGLDVDQAGPPSLWQPKLTRAEGNAVYAAYDDCLDLEQRDVEAFMAEGMSRAQALCASRGYRASGIPRVHTLEPPHTGEPTRVAAHADLEAFLDAAKQACRDWIRE
jgi:hypothetical protein